MKPAFMRAEAKGGDMMSEAILEMQHIAKAFSGIYALKDAQLTLHKGSVMALVGENGAGNPP